MQNEKDMRQIYRYVFIYGWIVVRLVALDLISVLLPRLVYLRLRLKLSHESILALVLDPDSSDPFRDIQLEMYWKQAENLSNEIHALETAHKKGR